VATETLRPNADVLAGWTESPAGAANAVLDDSVTDPTNAETSGDGGNINSSTAAAECEVHVGTFTLGTDEVSAVRLKVFAKAGTKRGIDWRLLHGTTQLAAGTRITSTTSAWYTATYTGSLTQAQIDDLRCEVVCVSTAGGGGATAAFVYAAYIEVDHAVATDPVSATRQVTYDVLGYVSGQRQVTYDMAGLVSATRQVSFDLRGWVSPTRALSYDVRGAVQASRSVVYDVRGWASGDRNVTYDLLGDAPPLIVRCFGRRRRGVQVTPP
jgi:hypothetical protein